MYKILIDALEKNKKAVSLIKFEDAGSASASEKVLSRESGDIDIVSKIAELLNKHNLSLENVEEFKAKNTPGSFTGLRISLTIANTLNWALQKKSVSQIELPNYGKAPNIQPRRG